MTWRFRTRIWRKNIDTVPRDYFILINNALMRCLHSGHPFRSFTNVLVKKTCGRGGGWSTEIRREPKNRKLAQNWSASLSRVVPCNHEYANVGFAFSQYISTKSVPKDSEFFLILNTENWSHGFPKESKVRMLWWIA